MRVLVACEESGRVRDAFSKLGHYAISADLQPSRTPGNHYQGDVFDIINDGFDLMIAHPPCTYLSNSGVSHLHKSTDRWLKLYEGAEFFYKLMNADIPKKAIENPIMHKYAKRLIGRVDQSQTIQPWMFGHAEQKATCLWLQGLPNLNETNNVKEEMMSLPDSERQRIHYLPPGKDRQRIRSETYQGVADAMANQWGSLERLS